LLPCIKWVYLKVDSASELLDSFASPSFKAQPFLPHVPQMEQKEQRFMDNDAQISKPDLRILPVELA